MIPHADLCEQVYVAGRALQAADLVTLTFGNASAVDHAAGVMAIKPSGVDYDELTPGAMVIVDIESGDAVGADRRPSSDTPTHLVLYRSLTGVGGIVHTHSRCATAWAQARRPIPCLGTTHADHFRGPVPVTRPLTPDEIETDYEHHTGDLIVETVQRAALDVPAVLVASHGSFVWGEDLETAVDNAIALELVADLALATLTLAPDTPALDEALLERHHSRKHGPGAYYGQART